MITWRIKSFQELTVAELYEVMQLRQEIFIMEQACIFVDADGKDISCHHILGFKEDKLIVYARIVPPGIAYKEVSIGRISTHPGFRKMGYGRALMEKALLEIEKRYGLVNIRIEAQLYLHKFYSDYGFVQQTPPYILDDIEHIIMLRTINESKGAVS